MNDLTLRQQQEISRQVRLAERLCEKTPKLNLENMVEVSKARGLSMRIMTNTRPKPDGTHSIDFIEAQFGANASNETRKEVLAVFEDMLTPATQDMIFAWLSMLGVKTNKKASSEKDRAAELKLYAEELNGFPADVVQYALQAKHYRWWPPVGDIIKICEAETAPRLSTIKKLQTLITRHEQDDYATPAPIGEKVRSKADFVAIDEILKNSGFVPRMQWQD